MGKVDAGSHAEMHSHLFLSITPTQHELTSSFPCHKSELQWWAICITMKNLMKKFTINLSAYLTHNVYREALQVDLDQFRVV